MRPQGALQNPPATLRRALKMALVTPNPDLGLTPDQNPGETELSSLLML